MFQAESKSFRIREEPPSSPAARNPSKLLALIRIFEIRDADRTTHLRSNRIVRNADDALPQEIARPLQSRSHQPHHRPVRRLAPRLRDHHSCGTKIRQGLQHSSERLSRAQWI